MRQAGDCANWEQVWLPCIKRPHSEDAVVVWKCACIAPASSIIPIPYNHRKVHVLLTGCKRPVLVR
eukprot:scaffold152985_cov23-Tisochrysis_lutea.AAC.3